MTQHTAETLADLSMTDLVVAYNFITGKGVRRFESRPTAIKRILEAQATHSRIVVPVDEPAEAAEEPTAQVIKEADEPAAEAVDEGSANEEAKVKAENAVDAKMVELFKAHAPCKVGVLRTAWQTEDPKFAAMPLGKQKATMRRSINRLLAAGKIDSRPAKGGAEFFIFDASQN